MMGSQPVAQAAVILYAAADSSSVLLSALFTVILFSQIICYFTSVLLSALFTVILFSLIIRYLTNNPFTVNQSVHCYDLIHR